MLAISLLKMYVGGWHIKSRWGTSVDAHEGRYFVWLGGSGGGGSGVGDPFWFLLLLKSWSARGASHHFATALLLITRF